MQFSISTILFLATAANAACTIRGFSGQKCTGAGGDIIPVTKSEDCIGMAGRQSYYLSDDCGSDSIQVWHNNGANCKGQLIDSAPEKRGCHGVAAASVKVKRL